MAKILCVSNQKGGVGKTTTTNALAMGLRRKGSRVLCVDFDPQGNLSFSLGADNRIELQNSVYHALKGELQPVQTIQHTPLCDVIPANLLLSGIDLEFTGKGREYLLRDCLHTVRHLYDHHPDLWARMLELQALPGKVSEKFNRTEKFSDIDARFRAEDAQWSLFEKAA